VAIEKEFDVQLTPTESSAGRAVQVRVAGDRLERDAMGRLVVVDLKTGAGAPSAERQRPILSSPAYQVAVEAGGFGPVRYLAVLRSWPSGTSHTATAVRVQPPLGESEDPAWAEAWCASGSGHGRLDISGGRERLLPLLRGEHVVPCLRQGKAGHGMSERANQVQGEDSDVGPRFAPEELRVRLGISYEFSPEQLRVISAPPMSHFW
jgi:hypothetical protein